MEGSSKRTLYADNSRPAKRQNTNDKKVLMKTNLFPVDAYTRHKILMNNYVLNKPGFSFPKFEVKTDFDVLKQNHRFLWDSDDDDNDESEESKLKWGERVAKKYYDRLYKEYCICDLSKYKENKIAMRWRVEKEVILGKGQFICGNKVCDDETNLKSWEVNFGYKENNEKKNALVKLRLCSECSDKLNYHHHKKEIVMAHADQSTDDPDESNEGSDKESRKRVDDFLQSLLV